MQGDVHQAAQALRLHCRNARNGRRVQHAIADHAQPTGTLGDQHRAVGQERQAPRVDQALGHHRHADPVLFGGVERPRTVADRLARDPDRLPRCAPAVKDAKATTATSAAQPSDPNRCARISSSVSEF